MFDPRTLRLADFMGGRLHEIAASAFAPGREDEFFACLREVEGVGARVRTSFRHALGWDAPRELAELIEIDCAWNAFSPDHPARLGNWEMYLDLCPTDVEAIERGEFFDWTSEPLTDPILLTSGVIPLAEIDSDWAYAALLPHPLDTLEVHYHSHDGGGFEYTLAYSVVDFLLAEWLGDSELPGVDEYEELAEEFDDHAEPARERDLPAHRDALLLSERAEWLVQVVEGETESLDELIEAGADLEEWEEEAPLLTREPHLANYWMLAHLFLGNDALCRQAMDLASKCSGTVTPHLAIMVERALEGAGLGELSPEKVRHLRDVVREAAYEDQVQ